MNELLEEMYAEASAQLPTGWVFFGEPGVGVFNERIPDRDRIIWTHSSKQWVDIDEDNRNTWGLWAFRQGSPAALKYCRYDPVNHPAHYTASPAKCEHGTPIECIQITEHMNFCLGNAVKYIWRSSLKGKPVEDLRKAVWYLEREIERIQNEN